jgi:CheY-like chemotaxis protein
MTMDNIKKPLILIVDDSKLNILVLRNILMDKGYYINSSNSGEEALHSIKIDPPDLILLDIQMPEISGYEVCKTLKSNTATEEIPIIFLTAASEKEDILKGFELGAVDYITKPFNDAELTARVATHIELVKHRNILEELVAHRTLELKSINNELKTDIKRRIEVEKSLLKSEEKLLKLNENLVEKNKEIEQFVFLTSHDLQEPLITMNSVVDLIEKEYSYKLDAGLIEYFEFIAQSTKRMRTLIKSILDYSQLGKVIQ